jgi:hypothetical protein
LLGDHVSRWKLPAWRVLTYLGQGLPFWASLLHLCDGQEVLLFLFLFLPTLPWLLGKFLPVICLCFPFCGTPQNAFHHRFQDQVIFIRIGKLSWRVPLSLLLGTPLILSFLRRQGDLAKLLLFLYVT